MDRSLGRHLRDCRLRHSSTRRSDRPQDSSAQARDFATSDHRHPYMDSSGFADFVDGDDDFAEPLRRAQHARANRRGEDLHYRLPIDFVESITGADKRLTLPEGGTLDVKIPPAPGERADPASAGQGRPRYRQRRSRRCPDRGGGSARPPLHARR
jgi:hypothetical protein